MCEPTTMAYAALALTAASGVANYVQQDRAAKVQKALLEDGAAQERLQTQRQYEEINDVAQEEQGSRYRDHMIDASRLQAIAAESALQGATMDRIAQEEANNAAQDMATIEANRGRQAEQAHSQGVAKQMQASSQLTGIRRPSALGAGLQIAAQVGPGLYNQYERGQRVEAAKQQYYEYIARNGPPTARDLAPLGIK